ncbi:MAG: YkgJ family cysteine cluster protein [Euryarchaeota archaeon]|nr:YkgJ family cysteine cluster protein [Euryarchaeota archaeon]
MLSAMRCTHCTKCCQDTRMELSAADIARLVRRGYVDGSFYRVDHDGIPRLVNVDGYCFFFDLGKGRCREYASRPLGCVIYPINLTEDGEAVIDDVCPEGESISHEELVEKAARLRKLLRTIDAEAAVRRRSRGGHRLC